MTIVGSFQEKRRLKMNLRQSMKMDEKEEKENLRGICPAARSRTGL